MKCSHCAFDNREGARFCKKCGRQLERSCPSCGTPVDADSLYCDHCGHRLGLNAGAQAIDYTEPRSYTPKHLTEKILTTRAALEGERKVVTVLFADVANYTSLSEKLDAEDVHRIMDGCFQILLNEVHRYEGTINQFTGDGVMALFGAPIAHEDHAQRACRAALSIQAALNRYWENIRTETGQAFAMRIGLNSGPVVVGAIGDDLRMDYTALGDTTNLAARVQQAAKPGEVWLSQHTRNGARGYFHEEFVGDVPLKGKAEPQPLYRLLSERPEVRTRFEAGLARGMTRFVGRHREIEALRVAFERARRGEAQVVDIVGEPGVGKSRLVLEFQNSIASEASALTGTCLPYGGNVAFLPVIDVLKRALGLVDGMREDDLRARITARATGDMVGMIPFFLNLLSLQADDPRFKALNPEGRKFGTFDAVKTLLLSVSEERPLVLFLEDVQWMDRVSEEFFTYLSRCIEAHKILMISAYRPEGSPPWSRGARYERIGLETLDPGASVELVRNTLAGSPLEPALEETIVEKAGGNPLFIEEIVRDLLDRGDLVKRGERYVCRRPLDQLEIPDTVQGVVAARMDRLGKSLKQTVQVAAVIGRYFSFGLLKSVVDSGDELRLRLNSLVGLEILDETAVYPDLEYGFTHALTQEVAYEGLLKHRRREIHGRIAQAIEAGHADNLEPHYETLAHHWELSDSPDKALEYLVLAGEKSNQSQAAEAAADYFTRALKQISMMSTPPDERVMLRIRLGRADPLHAAGNIEGSLNDYREAIRLARALGDERTVLKCHARVVFLIYNTTLKDEVPEFCEEGLALARKLADRGAEAQIAAQYAYWRHLWRHTQERQGLEEALALAKSSGNPQAVFFIQVVLAVTERWSGNPQRTLEYTQGLAEMLQSIYNIYLASSLSFTRGWALTDVGRYQEAVSHLTRWIDIIERNAIVIASGRCYNGLGWVYSELYDLSRAYDLNLRALEHAIALGQSPAFLYSASEMRAMAEVNLVENSVEMGRLEKAWDRIARFEEISRDPAYDMLRHRWSTRMNDVKAAILLSRGDVGGAQALSEHGLEVATRWSMKKYIGREERALGQVMTLRGAHERAESHFRRALQQLEGVGNPKQLWITHTALAKLYHNMERFDREREHWHTARALVRSTADALRDDGLRETFLAAAPVREILDRAGG